MDDNEWVRVDGWDEWVDPVWKHPCGWTARGIRADALSIPDAPSITITDENGVIVGAVDYAYDLP